MRKVLAIMEGEKLPDGRLVDIGAFYVDEADADRIAVTWANDATPMPIGWGHSFERKEHDTHADLSVDIILNDPNHQEALDHFDVYIFATDLVEEEWSLRAVANPVKARIHREDPPRKIVKKARIRMLQLVPIPGIPFGLAKNVPVGS